MIFIALENSKAAELVMVRVVSIVVTPVPTAPVNVTAPAAASTISVSGPPPVVPSVVPEMVTPPEPAVNVTEAVSPSTRLLPILMRAFVVDILLDKVAAPDVENPAGAIIAPVAPLVKMPELVTAIAPPAAAVKLLLTL